MTRRLVCVLLLLLLTASPSDAQLGLNYTTFTPQSTISSTQFTANFTNINDKALNRYAAVLKATLAVDSDAAYDLGASGARFRDGFFSRNLTVAGTATVGTAAITTLTCTGCVSVSQIATDGVGAPEIAVEAVGASELAATAVTAGSYGATTTIPTFTVDADGRLTAAASVATSALTGIVEAGITDGSIFPRLADNETITGTWSFPQVSLTGTTYKTIRYTVTDAGTNEKIWDAAANANSYVIQTLTDAAGAGAAALTLTRTGTTISSANLAATAITLTGNATTTGTLTALGATTLNGAATTNGTFAVGTNLSVGGNASVTGTLTAGTFAPTTVRVGNGSAGTPSLSFTNDTDTGWYSQGDGLPAFAVNGTTILGASSVLVSLIRGVGEGNDTALQVRNIRTDALGPATIGTSGVPYDAVYSTAYPAPSDRRLKQDITPLDYGVEFIDKLKPVAYRYVKNPAQRRLGFIAQDLKALGFEGVDASNPQSLALDYTSFIAPLVKATQEVHAEVHALAQVVLEQQQELGLLKARLRQLERVAGGRAAEN